MKSTKSQKAKAWPNRSTDLTSPKRTDTPFLTVIIPSYQQGKYLETAIRSVLCQGFNDFELLIFDGGSTDSSAEIIKKYADYIAYYEIQKDRGQAHAINKGIARARGKFIGWINADDYYLSNSFQKIWTGYQTNPEAQLFHGNRILTNQHDQVIGWTNDPPVAVRDYICIIRSEGAFWKKSLSDRTGPLKEKYHYALDTEFFLRLSLHCQPTLLPTPLAYYRCHHETKTSTGKEDGLLESKEAYLENCPELLEQFSTMPKRSRIANYMLALQNPSTILFPYVGFKLSTKIKLSPK